MGVVLTLHNENKKKVQKSIKLIKYIVGVVLTLHSENKKKSTKKH